MIKRIASFLMCCSICIALFGCGEAEEKKVTIRDGNSVAAYFLLNEENSSKNSIYIQTSLPIGMKFNVLVTAGKDKNIIEQTLVVKGGASQNYLQTATLLKKGAKALNEGRYLVKINSLPYSEQNVDVQSKIGEKGAHLVSKDLDNQCVYEENGERVVYCNMMLEYSGNSFKSAE